MLLKINNIVIDEPIQNILSKIKYESKKPHLFGRLSSKQDSISIACPFHSNGLEKHNSASIYQGKDNPNIEYGTFHCFTCSLSYRLPTFVSKCFDVDDIKFGENWLLTNFKNTLIETQYQLPEITLTKPKQSYLDSSILEKYNYYHPYMWKRNLTKEVVDTFQIGYDKDTNAITFPVWDDRNNLVMITKRCVDSKKFYIEKNIEKPIYLLNFIKNNNISKVYVVESQINCLTLWGWGYPAIALFGCSITPNQINILKKSGIRNYILCLDSDTAGKNGTQRFINNMPKDVFISQVQIPKGKDVNDLTISEAALSDCSLFTKSKLG